eukprot:TRINITY_DN1380_c0_g2_i1.p1 TRINITY_DN1380_c0_g2~~TRINITY_DN1380_c0_g2_i1.p1  ORF type:complete len:411 (-),score=41.54 TRINITY_DN1380_c0_g2_i1:338-1570(-)
MNSTKVISNRRAGQVRQSLSFDQQNPLINTTRPKVKNGGGGSTSLIPETLEQMKIDVDFQKTQKKLEELGQIALTREERIKRQRSLQNAGLPNFYKKLDEENVSKLVRSPAKIFQLNIGLYCNQACSHCHVESSPKRTEMMTQEIAQRCVELMHVSDTITTVDLTGGAPELNPQFRFLVEEASALGLEVIDRCNLTVLLEPGQEDLVDFLVKHKVRVVASLPCYSAKNVDQQRGSGVFDRSIKGLQMLNQAGYGQPDTGLCLDLVYNPNGIFLSPSQEKLQAAYKEELKQSFGIEFNNLFCINNMPIKRYCDYLLRRGKLQEYMQLLVDNFNPAAAEGVMCRDTISVGWDGRLYDCDFNQQLEIGLTNRKFQSVYDIRDLNDLSGIMVACDNHCYGCTAGAGSSCQGATS